LDLVAQARTERQIPSQANVVLQVQPALKIAIGDVRVAQAAGVVAGTLLEKGLEAVERVGAEIVRRGIGSVPAAIERDARAQRVQPAHVIQIGAEIERSG